MSRFLFATEGICEDGRYYTLSDDDGPPPMAGDVACKMMPRAFTAFFPARFFKISLSWARHLCRRHYQRRHYWAVSLRMGTPAAL